MGARVTPSRKNRAKAQVPLTPELKLSQNMVRNQCWLSNGLFPGPSLVLDGQFGNHNALAMAQQCGGLHFPDTGPYAGRGLHRK